MFPGIASERFHTKASRSFFTIFKPGKKPCWTLALNWSQCRVLVLSTGASFQKSCFSSGHVAAGPEHFQVLLPGCSNILSASAASTFFPGRNHRMAKSRAVFDQWLKRHRLPNTLHPLFEEYCSQQWQQHVVASEHSSRLNWAMLQKVKSALHKDLVLYSEDHHPNHVVCFCPRFFLRGLCNTWDDPSVFKSLPGSPAEWQAKMLEQIPPHLSRRYSWSFCKSAELPRCTVFLKRKKTVHQRADNHLLFRLTLQQVAGVGINCFDFDRQDFVCRQPGPVVDAPIMASHPQALVFA